MSSVNLENISQEELNKILKEEYENNKNLKRERSIQLRMNAQKFRARVGHSQKTNLPSFSLYREI